jgi:hypothetical protein
MHQTTVRFGADLWAELEREAAQAGVSIAQYVREAALARLAYSAGQRGETPPMPAKGGAPTGSVAAGERALGEAESSDALWAQGQQARERARLLREQTQRQAARLRLARHPRGEP